MTLKTIIYKILRWYSSPSGLLVLGALALLGLAFITSDPTSYPGIVGILLLATYFPYRSIRETHRADGMFTKVHARSSHIETALKADAELGRQGLQLANQRIQDFKDETRKARTSQLKTDEQLLASSALLTGSGYLPFNRRITDEAVASIIDYWSGRLDLEVAQEHIRYLERKFVFAEGVCDGRIATTSTDVVIRCLIAKSLADKTKSLDILEIGTLFGLGAFTVYRALFPFVLECNLTLLDPLEGYYGNDQPDPATGLRVTEEVLWSNRDRLAIAEGQVKLLKGYSNDPEIQKAAEGSYDLIVIDGDHSYDGIRVDFELYAGFLRVGGLMIIDDYGSEHWPDVKRYSDEVIKSDARFEFIGAQSRTGLFRRTG